MIGIANHTGITQQCDYFLQPFKKLFQRRAFIHWLIDEDIEKVGLFALFSVVYFIKSFDVWFMEK